MAGTKSCVACGKLMSDTLSSCPHCQFDHAKISCVVCGVSYYSQIIKQVGYSHANVCENCVHKIVVGEGKIDTLYSCPACNSSIRLQYNLEEKLQYNFLPEREKWYEKNYKDPLLFDPKKRIDDRSKKTFREENKRCSVCGHYFHSDSYPDHCKLCGLQLVCVGETKSKPFHKICYASKQERETEKTRAEKNTNKSNCFIATASCGVDSIQVITLRKFRDEKLIRTKFGESFVKVYEFVSPPFANAIRNSELFKLVTRIVIINPLYRLASLILRKN